MTTAAVKITEAEIKRQAAGSVQDVRDLENKGLYLRFNKARTGGSWYLVLKGKWNPIGTFPELTHKQVAAALSSLRLRLAAGDGASLSSGTPWVSCWIGSPIACRAIATCPPSARTPVHR